MPRGAAGRPSQRVLGLAGFELTSLVEGSRKRGLALSWTLSGSERIL